MESNGRGAMNKLIEQMRNDRALENFKITSQYSLQVAQDETR
jgi:hypothetical protein